MFDFIATQNLSGSFLDGGDGAYRPKGTYMWAYPYSRTQDGRLEVGSQPPNFKDSDDSLGPGGLVDKDAVCRTVSDQRGCWVEPEGAA